MAAEQDRDARERLLDALARGLTVSEAAAKAGYQRQSVYRLLRDPAFADELERRKAGVPPRQAINPAAADAAAAKWLEWAAGRAFTYRHRIPEKDLPSPEAAFGHPLAWAALASSGEAHPVAHLRYLGDQLMRLFRGDVKRLVVSMPPRHGKTWLLVRYLVSWWLGRRPRDRAIAVAVQQDLILQHVAHAKAALARFGEEVFGVSASVRSAAREWPVVGSDGRPTGGGCSAIGAEGTIVGKGADLMVVDDLVRNVAEAMSPERRKALWAWFESAIQTRIEPEGRVLVLMTRWHGDDVIGRILEAQKQGDLGEPFEVVNLPALAEDADPIGRAPGVALWPEKFTTAALEKKKKDVGPYMWSANYQGNPTPSEGKIFRKHWLAHRYVRDGKLVIVPERGTCAVDELLRFATVDLAASRKTRADYTVIATWGYHQGWKVLLLLDLDRDRLGGPEYVPHLEAAVLQHALPIVFVEREGPIMRQKLGFSVVKEAIAAGLPIEELIPDGDKVSRAIASTGALAAGQVLFREGASYLGILEEELLAFPDGAHDNVVDAVTYACGLFREAVQGSDALERDGEPPAGDDDAGDGWATGAGAIAGG